jgi:ATP-dependent Lon protease
MKVFRKKSKPQPRENQGQSCADPREVDTGSHSGASGHSGTCVNLNRDQCTDNEKSRCLSKVGAKLRRSRTLKPSPATDSKLAANLDDSTPLGGSRPVGSTPGEPRLDSRSTPLGQKGLGVPPPIGSRPVGSWLFDQDTVATDEEEQVFVRYTSGELLLRRQDIPQECKRVLKMLNTSFEQALDPKIKYSLHSKLEWYSLLPFESCTSFETDDPKKYLTLLREALDKRLYGLQEVKQQIIMAVHDRLRNPTCKRNILVLKGPKGSGKTKIAQIVANTIGLPFYKIALGGLIDATVFKGSDQVWSGSSPSMILQILARSRCSNPVILLDEIDKLSHSEKGIEVANSMLHVLDPTQNTQFHDLFLSEIPHDISGIWFFVTMNESSPLADALKDRLEIIEISPYTTKEMVQIVKKHIFPELMAEKNVQSELITLSDEAVELLCATKGKESLRTVERHLARLISKLSLLNTMGESHPEAGFVTFPCEVTVEYIEALCAPSVNENAYSEMYI